MGRGRGGGGLGRTGICSRCQPRKEIDGLGREGTYTLLSQPDAEESKIVGLASGSRDLGRGRVAVRVMYASSSSSCVLVSTDLR